MKKLLFIGLLITIFSCKSAVPDQIDEVVTLRTYDGQEFTIAKDVIVTFSETVKNILEIGSEPSFEFKSDVVKAESLNILLYLLEYARDVLVEIPTSYEGSYRQVAQWLIIERKLSVERIADLIILADFLDLDERIKQALACAIVNLIQEGQVTCEAVCALLVPEEPWPLGCEEFPRHEDFSILDMSNTSWLSYEAFQHNQMLPYIAQQYYLVNNVVPDIFEMHIKEIGISIRDLLIHEKCPAIRENDGFQVIDLSARHIRDLDGIADIAHIDQINTVDLDDNHIQIIPQDLNLSELTGLSIKNNQIQDIPEGLNLPSLEYMNLVNNQIQVIPEGLNLPNLGFLYLQNNQIQTIPEGLNLPNLRLLYLENNQIHSIPEDLNFPQLMLLELNNNEIRFVPGLNLPSLQVLYLNNNPINRFAFEEMHVPLLEELYLNGHHIIGNHQHYLGLLYWAIRSNVVLQAFPSTKLLKPLDYCQLAVYGAATIACMADYLGIM